MCSVSLDRRISTTMNLVAKAPTRDKYSIKQTYFRAVVEMTLVRTVCLASSLEATQYAFGRQYYLHMT